MNEHERSALPLTGVDVLMATDHDLWPAGRLLWWLGEERTKWKDGGQVGGFERGRLAAHHQCRRQGVVT